MSTIRICTCDVASPHEYSKYLCNHCFGAIPSAMDLIQLANTEISSHQHQLNKLDKDIFQLKVELVDAEKQRQGLLVIIDTLMQQRDTLPK